MIRRFFHNVREILRRYFVAGVVVFAPIAITIWAIVSIIRYLDNLLLPRVLKVVVPGDYVPPEVPLVGAVFTLLVIILFGIVARHFFGYELVRLWERLLSRVPVARNIYGAVKQLFEAIVSGGGSQARFRRVVMIEYPRKDMYALAFTTGPARGAVTAAVGGMSLVNCFVPTTPNPTSGFYLLVPEADVIEVDLTVEDAFKLVMSAGLVSPEDVARAPKTAATEPRGVPAPESP